LGLGGGQKIRGVLGGNEDVYGNLSPGGKYQNISVGKESIPSKIKKKEKKPLLLPDQEAPGESQIGLIRGVTPGKGIGLKGVVTFIEGLKKDPQVYCPTTLPTKSPPARNGKEIFAGNRKQGDLGMFP